MRVLCMEFGEAHSRVMSERRRGKANKDRTAQVHELTGWFQYISPTPS